MRRILPMTSVLAAVMLLAVPAVQLLSSSAAQAIENGSMGASVAPSWQSNATVWDMAYGAGNVFMVGDFTSLRPPTAALGTGEVPANYFAALTASTGALDTTFNDMHVFAGQAAGTLPLTKGAVAVSPDGSTVYVGGAFTSVDGQTRNHIAAFNTTTGALTSFAPQFNGRVNVIATSGNTVYAGGTFTKVSGVTRSDLAAVQAGTGAVLPWSPLSTGPMVDASNNISNTNDYRGGTVDALAVSADGSTVAAGGYFTTMNGIPANKAALLDATTGANEPLAADSVVPIDSSGCVSNVKDVVISGSSVYFANEGTGGGCLDGTWAANLPTGSLKWLNNCLGATQAIAVIGNYLYKGSHIHDCADNNRNGDPDNFPQVPTNQNRHVTSELLSNGFLGPWYPNMNAGPNLGPRTMTTDGSQLFVGGDFTLINGLGQQGIARFTPTSDYPTPRPTAPTATINSSGTVTVTAQSPVDLDDPDLTMQLFRDGGSTPIASTQVHSLFWKQPTVTWTDSGLAGGSHTYTVRAIETFGSGASPMSAPSTTITVAAAKTHAKMSRRTSRST